MKKTNHQPIILVNMAVEHNAYGKECEIVVSHYVQAVSDAGAIPMLLPSLGKNEHFETLLDFADGVLLIGGRDYPPAFYGEEPHPMTQRNRLRPECDLNLAHEVLLRRELPVLGICGGCQLINIATGGKLIQHLPNSEFHVDGVCHASTIIKDGFFSRGCGLKAGDTLTVNSFHHQALHPDFLGEGLEITATAFDGSIEVVEMKGERMVMGIQFHPERMFNLIPGIFGVLRDEAAAFAGKRGARS